MSDASPSYLRLAASGELKKRSESLQRRLEKCSLCPHHCGSNRLENEQGKCRTGRFARIASVGPHYGEERPLVGSRGSGTIFFAGCNLSCVYCQNDEISHGPSGKAADPEALAQYMLFIQELGCHNLNLVSPTHVTAQILAALCIAVEKRFHLPIVYNCGGYESVETLSLLDGFVDIYMPDLKYTDAEASRIYSGASDYPEVAQSALLEMHRQVGDLILDDQGVAQRGLLIRHLVLPDGLAGSEKALRFIAEKISKQTYVNIMDQYRPNWQVVNHPVLGRRIRTDEYRRAIRFAEDCGLVRLDDRRHY